VSARPETAAVVALLREGRRSWRDYAAALEEAGSAMPILEEDLGLLADERLSDAATAISGWVDAGIRIVTVLDPDYPENLRGVHDRPPLVFVAGHLSPDDVRSVAVIGSRRASDGGLRAAVSLAGHLVRSGYTVVSGLAAGIDAAAHGATLEAGGRTIGVIGTGLNHAYPPENAPLQRQITRAGAVVSQFWPDTGPTRQTFPMRNAVMSGLTLATVIVEAQASSGARIQARLALNHGRPVFLRHSLISQSWARELAERPGTHLVRSPSEVTETLERLSPNGILTQ
jgi:DNA processing protein